MATWSANHPYINFYNVTDECAAEGRTVTCTLAELYIGAKSPDVGDEEVAAFVLHNPDDVRTYSTQWKTGVRAPSGEVIGNDWQIKFATLTFHNHICWCAPSGAASQRLAASVFRPLSALSSPAGRSARPTGRQCADRSGPRRARGVARSTRRGEGAWRATPRRVGYAARPVPPVRRARARAERAMPRAVDQRVHACDARA